MRKEKQAKHEADPPAPTVEQNSENAENPSAPIHEEAELPAKVELTPEQIEELKTKAAKADENWDRLLRATADLENYKKRAARERQDVVRFANESLLEKLVPVLDNLDAALIAARQAQTTESLRAGVEMIFNQLKMALADSGLEEIDASQKKFDPNWHEAVSQQESADVPEGQVIQQVRKGYKLRERLLRPATVIVAKKPGG